MSAFPAQPMTADPRARLVADHQHMVWRHLRCLGASPEAADDLTQEVFLIAFARLHDLATPAAVATFLRTTASQRYWRSTRDQRRRGELLAAWQAERERQAARALGDDGGEAFVAALRQCLDGLPAEQRAAVQLTYGERLGRAATASRLGLQPNGLKTLLQRLRARLKACVQRRLEERG